MGFEDGGNCDLALGLSSGTFLGEVGDGAGGVWLAMVVLIDVGRTLFVRRRPVVGVEAVTLVLRVWPGGCDVLTLVDRARPLVLGTCEADAVEGALLRPLSVVALRAVDGTGAVPLWASDLAIAALLCTDCVRVCVRVDGALAS